MTVFSNSNNADSTLVNYNQKEKIRLFIVIYYYLVPSCIIFYQLKYSQMPNVRRYFSTVWSVPRIRLDLRSSSKFCALEHSSNSEKFFSRAIFLKQTIINVKICPNFRYLTLHLKKWENC